MSTTCCFCFKTSSGSRKVPQPPNQAIPQEEKNIDDLHLETYMSDILNIKDMDFTHANPNPDDQKSPGMNNRKMLNTLNVELSD